MKDKANVINKVSKIATLCLFVSIFLAMLMPVFRLVTLVCSCVIYICILINNKIKNGKINIVMLILCSASLTWMFLRLFYYNPYINILGLVIVYAFLSWSSVCNNGKLNKFVLIYGSLAILCSILNIYVGSNILNVVVFLLQFYIIFKFLDPILEKIGQAKRQQRLAYEAEQKRLKEEAEKAGQVNMSGSEGTVHDVDVENREQEASALNVDGNKGMKEANVMPESESEKEHSF